MTAGGCSATRRSRPTRAGYRAAARRGSSAFGADRGDRRGVDRQLRRRPGALPARRGVEVLEVNQPHPHTRRRRGKSDPIDAETGRPPRAGRQPARGRQGHERDRRGDPPAAGRARRRGQGAQRRAERARRPDRHRPRGSAPSSCTARKTHPRLARRSAHACVPTRAGCTSPSRRPRPRCARSRDASPSSTARSSCSTPAHAARRRGRADHHQPRRGRPPGTPPRCW